MSGKRKTLEQADREWKRWWKQGERLAKKKYTQPRPADDRAVWDFSWGFACGRSLSDRASQRSARAAGKKGRGK